MRYVRPYPDMRPGYGRHLFFRWTLLLSAKAKPKLNFLFYFHYFILILFFYTYPYKFDLFDFDSIFTVLGNRLNRLYKMLTRNFFYRRFDVDGIPDRGCNLQQLYYRTVMISIRCQHIVETNLTQGLIFQKTTKYYFRCLIPFNCN